MFLSSSLPAKLAAIIGASFVLVVLGGAVFISTGQCSSWRPAMFKVHPSTLPPLCASVYICAHAHIHGYATYIRIHTHIYACVCIGIVVCVYVRMYVYVRAYV